MFAENRIAYLDYIPAHYKLCIAKNNNPRRLQRWRQGPVYQDVITDD